MVTTKKRVPAKNVDEYIDSFPENIQKKLGQLRRSIRAIAPKAEEKISYGIAGYRLNGVLIFFAGFKNHISIYPAPRTAPAFKKELEQYAGGKGTVQFPVDKPVPIDLVKRIIRYRMELNNTTQKPAKRKHE